MLSFKDLWSKNSIFSKVAAMSIASIFLSSLFLATYLIHSNLNKNEENRNQVILEQIKQTLSLTEEQQLASRYKEVTKALNNIQSIEEVVLYNKDCELLFSIPMNANHKSLCEKKAGEESKIIYELENSFSDLKYVTAKVFRPSHLPLIIDIIGLIVFVVIFSIATTLLMLIYLRKYFQGSFNEVIDFILNISPTHNSNTGFSKQLPQELVPLKETLLKTKKDLLTSQEKIVEQEKKQAVAEICLQIAHDIRSPLPIIESFSSGDLNNSTQKDRELLKIASKRITDIADQLLRRKDDLLGVKSFDDKKEVTQLSPLINKIVEEKTATLKSKDISIIFESKSDHHEYELNPVSFTRVLSNLIQNSIEAISGQGEIYVTLDQADDNIEITIKDNGKGIKQEDIIRVQEKGISINKPQGTGLGLSYTKEVMQSLGGQLLINSDLNTGTVVTLSLPQRTKSLDENSHYILIDNDDITHFNWKQSAKKDNIHLTTFFTPEEFYQHSETLPKKSIVCIDSDLGDNIKGENEAQVIYEKGFINIFLVTGKIRSLINKNSYISEVRGKSPLWRS